jgi:hypothetical protein
MPPLRPSQPHISSPRIHSSPSSSFTQTRSLYLKLQWNGIFQQTVRLGARLFANRPFALASSRLPRQVRRRSQAGVPQRPTELLWKSGSPRSAQNLRRLATVAVPKRLGGLRKTSFSGPEYVLQYLGRTPTALPFPIIVWFPLQKGRSPFAGAIPLITTNRSS